MKELIEKSEEFCLDVPMLIITSIHLNSAELGFCCGNSYHNGLTLTCTLLVALIYDVLRVFWPALFETVEWKENVFNNVTSRR